MNNLIKKLFILPIRFYQIFISPWLGKNKCRFYPSCSAYAVEAIEKKGIIKGIFLAMYRILRCNPWGKSGFDPVDNNKK